MKKMLGKELKSMRVYCDYTLRELADKISTEEKNGLRFRTFQL